MRIELLIASKAAEIDQTKAENLLLRDSIRN